MITVYHNPCCSKSRETLQLLTDKAIDFETRYYLQTVPSKAELKHLLSLLGFASARELMRTKESIYQALDLGKVSDEETLLDAMIENPKLIERPIVVVDDKVAKIGRPPESVLTLFN
ncbi:MAG: arsenate reductase (glutaredoxin) [Ostreibacterium sp.]